MVSQGERSDPLLEPAGSSKGIANKKKIIADDAKRARITQISSQRSFDESMLEKSTIFYENSDFVNFADESFLHELKKKKTGTTNKNERNSTHQPVTCHICVAHMQGN